MYKSFAAVYDRLMADVDYPAWIKYYEEIFARFGISPRLVLELGCGTGNVTLPMAKKGYEMIALDSSEEMLGIAAEKAQMENQNILFLNQDMREFELYGTVDAIVSALDCINYINSYEDIIKVFYLVKNYLNPGGVFVFDINSEYKLSQILGNNTFSDENDGVFYVWENEYSEKKRACSFYLTFFVKASDGRYDRFDEAQTQRAYSVDEILAAAEKTGLKVLGVYDEFSFSPPRPDSERIFFVLRRDG